MHREGINYPKFKDQFAAMDFEAEPMPVLSLFPMPSVTPLDDWEVLLTGAGGQRRLVCGRELRDLPVYRLRVPMVCQIFNWVERPEVEGVRLVDLLAATGMDAQESGFFAFYSKDGLYFEGLPRSIARDPRVLLVFGLNGKPLLQGIRRPAAPVGALPAGVQECEVGAPDSRFPQGPGGHQTPSGTEQDGDTGP